MQLFNMVDCSPRSHLHRDLVKKHWRLVQMVYPAGKEFKRQVSRLSGSSSAGHAGDACYEWTKVDILG